MRIFTYKPPCGPKRGHGTSQPRYAVEVHLDKIAHDLGIDPVEFRRHNLVQPYTRTVNGLRITSCALGECLDQVVERSGWHEFQAGKKSAAPDVQVKSGNPPEETPVKRGLGLAASSYICGAGKPI